MRDLILVCGTPQALHGLVQLLGGLDKPDSATLSQSQAEVSTAQVKAIEGDFQERRSGLLHPPLLRLPRPHQHLPTGLPVLLGLLQAGARPGEPIQPSPVLRLRPAQEQIAVWKTPEWVEPEILWRPPHQPGLSLAENRRALFPPARLVQGVGPPRRVVPPLVGSTAAAGVQFDALLAERRRVLYFSQDQGQPTEVTGSNGCLLPILPSDSRIQCCLHRLDGLLQTPQGA